MRERWRQRGGRVVSKKKVVKRVSKPGGKKMYLTHMMKILCIPEGRFRPSNTSANRSKPRPLLVVHSGKTTMGLSEWRHMSSKLSGPALLSTKYGGTRPVEFTMLSNDTGENPRIEFRVFRALFGEETSVGSVRMRRPGLRAIGDGLGGCDDGAPSHTGRTNTGLKLGHS
jgi:hypothetical protein